MSIKSILKKTIGAERLSNMKGQVFHIACKAKLGTKALEIDNQYLEEKKLIEFPKYHTFRGYYDLNYLSADKTKFLVHRLPINANNNKDTSCEIGYIDMMTGDFRKVAESSAWCWQQGSRLRWHPTQKDQIIFNDVDKSKNQYITRIVRVSDKQEVRRIEFPLYDISGDFSYGLSVNFSRLQRLRPGYGYNYFEDTSKGVLAPEDDGLYKVDLSDNKSRLLYSLRYLAEEGDVPKDYECYLNHISIWGRIKSIRKE